MLIVPVDIYCHLRSTSKIVLFLLYPTDSFDIDLCSLYFYFPYMRYLFFLLNFNWILRSIQEHHQRLQNDMVNENLCEYLFDKTIW